MTLYIALGIVLLVCSIGLIRQYIDMRRIEGQSNIADRADRMMAAITTYRRRK